MKQVLYYKVLTSLHIGEEQGLGYIDLPIQREIHTGFPTVPSSSLKGALRRVISDNEQNFYGDIDKGINQRGSIIFGDLNILLFPVKTITGLFVYLTCPYILTNFGEGEVSQEATNLINEKSNGNILCHTECTALINNRVILEEFEFIKQNNSEDKQVNCILESILKRIQGSDKSGYVTLPQNICIVSNDAFASFVDIYTEIRTRIKLGDDGIVEHGPFIQEFVPKETIFYGEIRSNKETAYKDYIKKLQEQKIIQLGANETLGNGLMQLWGIKDGCK